MDKENEKMEALKRAYAEIILNASKEAAARVMASEQKAQLSEKNLRSAKDEAYRMLIRLKQMLDAKTTDAETNYINQQNKIEELEAQLNEAENVILNLRVELKQTEQKLYEVKAKDSPRVLKVCKTKNKPRVYGKSTCPAIYDPEKEKVLGVRRSIRKRKAKKWDDFTVSCKRVKSEITNSGPRTGMFSSKRKKEGLKRSAGNRRLVQIARQLISLSGRNSE